METQNWERRPLLVVQDSLLYFYIQASLHIEDDTGGYEV